jgi:hypothetical protein
MLFWRFSRNPQSPDKGKTTEPAGRDCHITVKGASFLRYVFGKLSSLKWEETKPAAYSWLGKPTPDLPASFTQPEREAEIVETLRNIIAAENAAVQQT